MPGSWRAALKTWYWRLFHRLEETSEWEGLFFHDRFDRVVSFSFDDGPREEHTVAVSRVLAQRGVRGVFFVEGWRVMAYPVIVRDVDRDGHLLGNHTFSHRLSPERFTPLRVASEIVRTERAIDKVLRDRYPRGYPHHLFRPPAGFPWSREGTALTRKRVMRVLARLGYKLVLWQIDSADWQWPSDPAALTRHCIAQLETGQCGMFLFHDSHPALAPALADLIDYCRAHDIAIVDYPTLDALRRDRSPEQK
jgi:peptidoglycan/xylan/chitin deacetylase (PgdA/CDA1 family)